MRLLVSVSNADEACAAARGGADIIDAKEPSAGALGAVGLDVFAQIRAVVDRGQLVTAALGDAEDARAVERLAQGFVECGAGLVKFGFGAMADMDRVAVVIARVAALCSAVNENAGVVAVAYADGEFARAVRLISIAARAGARGVLVDTADKQGPGLMGFWSVDALESWVVEAHAHGLLVAVAGRLTAEDLAVVCETGADVAGVRGAACDGGRSGQVSVERVKVLKRHSEPRVSTKWASLGAG